MERVSGNQLHRFNIVMEGKHIIICLTPTSRGLKRGNAVNLNMPLFCPLATGSVTEHAPQGGYDRVVTDLHGLG